MQYLALTLPAIMDICKKEVFELTKAKSEELIPGVLLFSALNVKDLLEKAQSCLAVHEYLGHFPFTDLQDILESARRTKFPIKGTFSVRCERKGAHDFNSQEVERKVGEMLHKQGFAVNLSHPETKVVVIIDEKMCFFCMEVASNLAQREYMVKRHNQGVNSCLAYGLVRLSGYAGDGTILDPFCKDGAIVIEAARFKLGEIYGFTHLFQELKMCEVNAKLAGVKKAIHLSRYDVEWLDVKLEKGSVQHVVTSLPYSRYDLKGIEKVYREFFMQADYILKKNGVLVLLVMKPGLVQQDRFKLVETRDVKIGDMNYQIMLLKR